MLIWSCSADRDSGETTAVNDTTDGESSQITGNPLKEAYFGEEHLHTGVSMDAFIAGTRIGPDEAYRFAKGEEIEVNGMMHRIKRPLDWCAVTDHSEFMGEAYTLMNPESENYNGEVPTSFREATNYQEALRLYMVNVLDVLVWWR